MSLTFVIIGSIGAFMATGFLGMLAIFSAAGFGNCKQPIGALPSALLSVLVLAMPASAIASGVIVIIGYFAGGSATTFWWYALPAATLALYLCYINILGRFVPDADFKTVLTPDEKTE